MNKGLLVILLVLSSNTTWAHDFWLEPSVPPRPGERIALHLFVGQNLSGDEVPYRASRVVRFESQLGHKVGRLVGQEEDVPAAWLTAEPGIYGVAYESTFSSIVLDPEKFTSYLQEEHLESVVEERARRRETSLPGHERYARSCRSVVVVPGGRQTSAEARALSAPVGLTLELVPESDLGKLLASGSGDLSLRLLYRGKPLASKVVTLRAQSRPLEPLTQITDEAGRVHFRVERPDFYMAKAVHMVRCEGCQDADWESRWASFAFRLSK